MLSAGIDLHSHSLRVRARDQALAVVAEKTLACAEPAAITACFAGPGAFTAVVEAASGGPPTRPCGSAAAPRRPSWPWPGGR